MCYGGPKAKIEVFFNLMQEGGVGAHQFISATDKDFIPVW